MATQPPPTDAPAPAPAAPTPVPPPSARESMANDFAALRNEFKLATAFTPPPSPEPAPAAPEPAQDASTAPEPTPPADQALSGSTPAEPAPASTDPQPANEFDYWKDRYGGDPNRAAREALALEQRAVELARKNKELEARLAGSPAPASADPTAPPPAPPADPAAAAPSVPAEPAHPAPPAPVVPDLQELALKAASTDRVCCDLDTQFVTDEKRLGEVAQTELPNVAGEIVYLNRRITEVKDSDPVTASELQAQLDRHLLTKERLETERFLLEGRLESTKAKYQSRFNAIKGRFESERKAQQDREAAIRAVDRDAAEFSAAVKTAFVSEYALQKLDPEIKADLFRYVTRSIDTERTEVADVPRLVREILVEGQKFLEKAHRVESRRHALRQPLEPAPPPTPAPPSPGPANPAAQRDLSAHLDGLKHQLRQATRARRVGP